MRAIGEQPSWIKARLPLVLRHRFKGASRLASAELVDNPLRVVTAVLLGGFALFDRAFAYLHIPGTVFYIGEVALILCLFYVVAVGRYRNLAGYSVAAFFLGILVIWSIARAAPYLNDYGVDVVRDSVVWYFCVLGLVVYRLVVNGTVTVFTRFYDRFSIVSLLWYPLALLLSQFVGWGPAIPDSNVSVFSHKTGNLSVQVAMAIAWIWLCSTNEALQKGSRRLALTSLGMVTLLAAGIINRGGLVAATTALLIAWAFAGKRLRRAALTVPAVLIGLLGMFWLLDVRIQPSFTEREISVPQLVTNLRSIFGGESADDIGNLESTVSWRLDLWERTLQDVNENAPLTGRGYGMNLGVFYGVQGNLDSPLRSPHNSHLTIFARSGWFGFGAWLVLWTAWFMAMTETRRRYVARGDRSEGNLALWCAVSVVAILVNAIFDPALESPQVSAWLWAIFGLGLGLWHGARWPSKRPSPAYNLKPDIRRTKAEAQPIPRALRPS